MAEAPELISSNYRNEHGEFTDEGTALRPYEAKVPVPVGRRVRGEWRAGTP